MNQPVHAFRKSAIHEIHFEVAEHEGKRFVDVRTWALSPDGSFVPTSKPGGVNFPVDLLPEFETGVRKVHAALSGDEPKGGS